MNGRYLVVYFLRNQLADNRFGFCAGRKLGPAVRRNRIKRVMREAVRAANLTNSSTDPGWDIVLVARNNSTTVRYQNIVMDYEQVMVKTGIFQKTDHTKLGQSGFENGIKKGIKEEGKDSQ